MGLEGAEKRFIWQLSGGQRQRVGIARALAANPQLLLLDEPFGALDAFTREQMQTLLLRLWHETGKQVLLITHDIEEAVFMATELVLLSPGPGRVLERLPLDFARRYVAGEPVRSIKSDPLFIEQREYVLSRVFEQREAFLMSIVFSEKTRRTRLALRWPFSRQITLSVAERWPCCCWCGGQVTALRLIPPAVSAAAGTGAGQTHYHRRAAGLYGCHALAALRCQPGAYSGGAAGGGDYRHSGGDCDGAEPDGARHPRPAD